MKLVKIAEEITLRTTRLFRTHPTVYMLRAHSGRVGDVVVVTWPDVVLSWLFTFSQVATCGIQLTLTRSCFVHVHKYWHVLCQFIRLVAESCSVTCDSVAVNHCRVPDWTIYKIADFKLIAMQSKYALKYTCFVYAMLYVNSVYHLCAVLDTGTAFLYAEILRICNGLKHP